MVACKVPINNVVNEFHDAIKSGGIEFTHELIEDGAIFFDGSNSVVLKNTRECIDKHFNNNFLKCLRVVETKSSTFSDVAISTCKLIYLDTYSCKNVEFELLETIVFKFSNDGRWRIINIHWSN